MRRVFSLVLAAVISCSTLFGQAKKPVIMVVPSDAWCVRNGYVQEFESYGQKEMVPDYNAALKNNAEIRLLISYMGDFMAKEEFPIQSLESVLKNIQNESRDVSMITSNESGAMIMESPVDELRRVAKPDIILDIDYQVKKKGPKKQVSFNLTAYDAYTSKIISGNTGVGSSVNAPVEVLLEEAVLSFKDNFLRGLQNHFDDMFANGREVVVTLRRFDTADVTFEEEFDYQGESVELADLIDLWFSENTVQGRYSFNERTADVLKFEQVRIPLYGKNIAGKEVAIDTRGFVKPLVKMLKDEPYYIPVTVYQKGLGEVWLIIGEE
jgi:hypothetical protein